MCGSILVGEEDKWHFCPVRRALPDSGCLRETLFQPERLQDPNEDETISVRDDHLVITEKSSLREEWFIFVTWFQRFQFKVG